MKAIVNNNPQLPKELIRLLQKAYSGEKAAAYAYQGHAASLKDQFEKKAVNQIEIDEWNHRSEVLSIMKKYNVPVSKFNEIRSAIIGRIISMSCHVIGRFMPFFFAGKLESGNVCEYFRMIDYFNSAGINRHNDMLYEMGLKEKEHEIYFLERIKKEKMLPVFRKIFSWGCKEDNLKT